MSKNSSFNSGSSMGRPSQVGSVNRSISSRSNAGTSSSVTNNASRIANNVKSMSSKERMVSTPVDTRSKNRPGTSPTDAKTVVGRIHYPIKIQPGTNKPETIGGRMYSGHAFDRMQGRGIYPSVVENAIKTGQSTPGSRKGTTAHYDPKNKITVITNAGNGRVITTYPKTKR